MSLAPIVRVLHLYLVPDLARLVHSYLTGLRHSHPFLAELHWRVVRSDWNWVAEQVGFNPEAHVDQKHYFGNVLLTPAEFARSVRRRVAWANGRLGNENASAAHLYVWSSDIDSQRRRVREEYAWRDWRPGNGERTPLSLSAILFYIP